MHESDYRYMEIVPHNPRKNMFIVFRANLSSGHFGLSKTIIHIQLHLFSCLVYIYTPIAIIRSQAIQDAIW